MARRVHKATHEGRLGKGLGSLPCAVLENGWRVLSLGETVRALGYKSNPEVQGPVSGNSLFDYLPSKVVSRVDEASTGVRRLVSFLSLDAQRRGGSTAFGVRAEILPVVCEAVLRARDDGALRKHQQGLAVAAERLVRALARVGIIALIDEATGYQEIRDRDALDKILETYLAPEMQPWVKRFPDDYYKEIARLHRWEGDILSGEKPGVLGHYTNDLVYARLAPGILDALHARVPRGEKGKLEHRLHQEFREEGVRRLEMHLVKLVTFMQSSRTWTGLMMKVNKFLPSFRTPPQGVLDLEDPEDE